MGDWNMRRRSDVSAWWNINVSAAVKKQIMSRIIALLILGIPLAFSGLHIDNEELNTIDSMTHEQLISHIQGHAVTSFTEAYAMTTIPFLLYIAILELSAFGMRRLFIGPIWYNTA